MLVARGKLAVDETTSWYQILFQPRWGLLRVRVYESINPLAAGAVHIRFLHCLLAHYVSALKTVKNKTRH